MWLYSETLSYARWAFSISNKIRRIAPVSILMMVAATLVSQLTLMLASLLPLKIILLIGSSRVPRYFPQSFAAFDHETLVVGLGIATVCFYLIHLIAEKFIAFRNEHAANRVLARAGKLTLFANQEEMARGAIRMLARGMANGIFILAALALIAVIHPWVSLVLAAWCILVYAGAAAVGALSGASRSWLEDNGKSFIGNVASAGTFVVVGSIVVEYLLGAPFNILFAVVSLILSRQILQSFATSMKEALTLNAQKQQINALFFYGHALPAPMSERGGELWELCRGRKLEEWLASFIADATNQPVDGVRITEWYEIGMTDIFTFQVSLVEPEEESTNYLVKLYSKRRRMLAAHEYSLLSAVRASDLPCLPLLAARRFGEADCHLFRQDEARQLRAKEKMRCFLQACWLHEPPAELVQRYQRSHQPLFQQFSPEMGERLLRVAVTPKNEADVRSFMKALEAIREQLQGLPLFFYCPDATVNSLLELENGKVVATEWGRWTVEPVGAGWPTGKAPLAAIGPWLKDARAQRPALTAVSAEQIRLAALSFAFRRHYARQRYNSALNLLPAMLACINAIGASQMEYAPANQATTGLKKTGS